MSAETNFHFRAGAPEGGIFSGRLDAGSADEAAAILRQRGFVPLRVDDQPIGERWLDREIGVGGGKKLSAAECEGFARELAMLLHSGINVVDALTIMTGSPKSQRRLLQFATAVRHGLQLGRSLSDAVDGAGMTLSTDFVPVLRAGELAGSPARALQMLADSYGDRNRFARVYVSAMAYPALLLSVSLLVLSLIAFFVAPNLAGLFASMDKPAPFAIAALAGLADFAAANALLLLVGGVALTTTLVAAGSRADVRRATMRASGRLPVIGSAVQWSATGRLAATLGLGLANGVPLGAALPNALVSAGYGESLQLTRLVESVRAGGSLSGSLATTGILPPKAVHMLAVGESSGRLVEVLSTIVTEARARFEQRVALLTALLAPALILVVGSLIGAVIYSVFSALLNVNEITF